MVYGRLPEPSGEIAAPIQRHPKNRKKMGIVAGGREAFTSWRLEQSFTEVSFLKVVIKTGRTHQIRVHGQHIGHPLAGDEKYGDEQFNRRMRAIGLRRMLLHAHMIEFVDPYDDEVITVSSPLDENVRAVLGHLET